MAGQKHLQVDTATAVDDSYPLSPMQEGMWGAGLAAPHSGAHLAQVIGILPEELDLEAFHSAWSRVLERHDILRAAFRVTDRGPRQVLHQQVRVPFDTKDWRSLSTSEQHKRLEAHLAADRRRGFDFSAPPLMRLALFQTGQARHLLAWTFHHLILDGRSVPILLDEVFRGYEGLELPASRPYREYLEWLQQHRDPNAESFWRHQHEGFKAATPLAIGSDARKAPNRNARRRVQTVAIPAGATARVRALAEQHGLTVGTVLQGAWSVLLHRYGGGAGAVFGVVCPGRPGSVDGADCIVGPCANI